MNHEDANWIVVTSEEALSPILSPPQEAPANLITVADSIHDTCSEHCRDAALRLVREGRPVALLVSPPSQQLRRLRIPAVGRVFELWQEGEEIYFKMSGSQQPFIVPANAPFAALVASALTEQMELVVVGSQFDGRVAYLQQWTSFAKQTPCDSEFKLDSKTLSELDAVEACELYRDIFLQESKHPFLDGLPFRYSPSCCDTIAGAVALFAETQKLTVGKVWAFSGSRQFLKVNTSGRRSCLESWWFHVAVVTRRKGGGLWVFDPKLRLERGVTTYNKWKDSFGTNLGTVRFTTADAYILACSQTSCDTKHPCFFHRKRYSLETDLAAARCMLGCLCDVEGEGECPPYDFCGFPDELPDCSKVKI